MSLQIGGLIGAVVIFALALIVNRWSSFEALSNLQTALTILVTILGVLALTVKLRTDHLKKGADTLRAEERAQLDKELKEKTEAIEAKTRRRSISDEQKRNLLARLANAPKGKVFIAVTESDLEAVAFASEISDLLKTAGFGVEMETAIMMSGPSGAPVGLIFSVRDASAVPPHAQAIGDAFHVSGIPLAAGPNPSIPDDRLNITVGAKPLQP
jgi:hypothetical protein